LYLQLQILARGTRDLPAGPGTTKFVAMIDSSLKSARAITALLNGLLDLTRLRVGKFELHRQHCDLIAVVNDVVGQLATDAARAGSTVQVRSEGSVVGNFDIMRMGQVITNLLSNAIKYGCGKPIEISLRADGNQAVICVVDGGGGIVPEQQSLIFERFERAQTDTGISGLGLGLYIAQQIVKAHGGMISVESSVGKGSVFTVRV
jgi:signal transduction histidine kinase